MLYRAIHKQKGEKEGIIIVKLFEPNTRLSDVIDREEIRSWRNNNVIFNCGTGTGKTYFILNEFSTTHLKPFKRILILSSRIELRKAIQKEIDEGLVSNVDVTSYQHIEEHIKKGITQISPYFKKKYDIIVLDECQHFIENISKYTDLSFEWVMKQDAQKIFMSATAAPLFLHLIEEEIVSFDYFYHIPKSYEYVNDIYFFNKKSDLDYIVDDLYTNTTDKIIVFINSIEHALKLYKRYEGDVTFYCSPSTKYKKTKKHKKANAILENQPHKIENETFPTRLLVTTSALDVGITLKDYAIKHVVASVFQANQLAQCLGRKREILHDDKRYIKGKHDTCTFYIRNFSKREFNMFDNSKELEEMNVFQSDYEKWKIKYGMNRSHNNQYIPYDFDKKEFKLNELAFISIKQNQRNLLKIKGDEKTKGMGYKQFIISELRFPESKCLNYDDVKQEQQELTLEQYLDSIVGKQLFKTEQLELKEMFKNNGLSARTLGINTLNGNLKDRKLPYVILAKRSSVWENGKSKSIRWWQVDNNIQN